MTVSDSTSVFAEGTFEDQIHELVTYIFQHLPDEDRAAALQPFENALKTEEGAPAFDESEERRKSVFELVLKEINGLGDGSEKEIEGFFNLIYSHLMALYEPDSPELQSAVSKILQIISSSPSEHTAIKYRILANLFNALPRTSALRYSVYRVLLKIAISTDTLNSLHLSRENVERWLSEWNISAEDKSAFLGVIVDAYAKSEQSDISYEYALSYLRSLPSSSETARAVAVETIATALRLPATFNFDPLFRLDAVIAVKDDEIFSLLQVFLSGTLSDFKSWVIAHPGALEKYSLDQSELERKIRLLTLSSLGFTKVGQHVPYSVIGEALQVDVSQVESWVIDVIRSGLLSGKLSQTSQSLYITRSTAREFEKAQWEALEKRLLAWKAGLAGVLEVTAAARRQGGQAVPPPPQTVSAA